MHFSFSSLSNSACLWNPFFTPTSSSIYLQLTRGISKHEKLRFEYVVYGNYRAKFMNIKSNYIGIKI